MAQLCRTAESGGGAVCEFRLPGFNAGEAKTGRTCRFCDSFGLDGGLPGGRVVAYGMEVSALRENIWKPVVDPALHQLRVEQGRRGGGGAKKIIHGGFTKQRPGFGLPVRVVVAFLPWLLTKLKVAVLLYLLLLEWPGNLVALAPGGWNARPHRLFDLLYGLRLRRSK